MYLHLGNGFAINSKRILGIFSYGIVNFKNNQVMFDFLKKNRRFIYIAPEEEPRSIVLTKDLKAYVSNISCQTLTKRMRNSIIKK